MKLEFKTIAVEINNNFQEEIERLAVEGWQLVPGTQPVAVYSLQRLSDIDNKEGLLTMGIDDSKIGIIKGQKIKKE